MKVGQRPRAASALKHSSALQKEILSWIIHQKFCPVLSDLVLGSLGKVGPGKSHTACYLNRFIYCCSFTLTTSHKHEQEAVCIESNMKGDGETNWSGKWERGKLKQ